MTEQEVKTRSRLNLTIPTDLIDYVKMLAKRKYTSSNAIIIMMILFWADNHPQVEVKI